MDKTNYTLTNFKGAEVPTNTLQVGDEFIAHNLVFRVREVIVSKSHTTENGPCHANISDCLTPDSPSNMPKSWRDGWNQQGNSLARTFKIEPGQL